MKKFFKNIEQALFDMAVEKEAGEFVYSLESGKYLVKMTVDIESKKGKSKVHYYYKMSAIEILNEDDKNVATLFPMLVEKLENSIPCLDDVENFIEESGMSEDEIFFGSEAGYLRYKYGY